MKTRGSNGGRWEGPCQLVVFSLDGLRYALHLAAVEKVVRAVEITPLPKAPEIVMGVVNVQGRIVPVVNVRKRFHLPERELNLEDQFILAKTRRRPVALVVDAVADVVQRERGKLTGANEILPDLQYVEGVAKLDDGLILIHNLDHFLSLDEEKALDEALVPEG
jgi:purine-binding chemotaxis protein CheW